MAGKRPVPCGFAAGGTAGCRWSEVGEEITCKSPVLSSTCGVTCGSLQAAVTLAQTRKPWVAAGAEAGEVEEGRSVVAVGPELASTLRGPRGWVVGGLGLLRPEESRRRGPEKSCVPTGMLIPSVSWETRIA